MNYPTCFALCMASVSLTFWLFGHYLKRSHTSDPDYSAFVVSSLFGVTCLLFILLTPSAGIGKP